MVAIRFQQRCREGVGTALPPAWSSSMRLNADTAPVRRTPRLTARPCYNECSPACLVNRNTSATWFIWPSVRFLWTRSICTSKGNQFQPQGGGSGGTIGWILKTSIQSWWTRTGTKPFKRKMLMMLSRCGRPNSLELSHSIFHQKSSKKIKPKIHM